MKRVWEKLSSNKLAMILAIFCIIAVGLSITLSIKLYQQNLQLSYVKQFSSMQNSEGDDVDVNDKISAYQTAIDAVKDVDPKIAIEIYQARVSYLMGIEDNVDYKNQIFADLTVIDEFEQSTDSAVDMINYANYFNDEELSAHYTEVYNSRQESEEIDVNVEVRG